MQDGPSFRTRAILAIALTVAFYVLAVVAVIALVGIPLVRWGGGDGFPVFIGIAMIFSGLSVAKAIVPRRQSFTPPGPELTDADQPELLGLVREVADEVGHPMPDATYLDADANAGVTEVGSLGAPKKRILILGLPLLELLSADQLRAVIAHEFGHYVGGDTRVGGWIYRTRETLRRTVDTLTPDDPGDDGWYDKAVRAPFAAYTKLFLRITAAISRRQEYAADALAVKTAGRDAHVGALRRIAAGAPAFHGYWEQELAPALNAGYRPPIGEGFRRFLSADLVDRQVEQILESSLEESKHDPYDSHPTLRQRLDAVGADPREDPPSDGPAAIDLLRGHEQLERDLLVALAGDAALELKEASWDETQGLWLDDHREIVERFGSVLEDQTVGDVPDLAANLRPLAAKIWRIFEDLPEEEVDYDALAFQLLAGALAVALVREGFEFVAPPGEPGQCVRGGVRFAPVLDVGAIMAQEERPQALAERLRAAGVADKPLVTADTTAAEPAAS